MRWLALVLLVGCGNGIDGYTVRLARVECARADECGRLPDVYSRGDCFGDTLAFEQIVSACSIKSCAFDPVSGSACADAIRMMSCDDDRNKVVPDECDGVWFNCDESAVRACVAESGG